MEPTTDGLLGWKVASGLSVLLSGIVGWIAARTINKVDALREVAVTRPELNLILEQLRDDRKSMHEENKLLLHRLETRMEVMHRESNDRRHSLADRVQELSLAIGQSLRERP